MTDTKTLWYLLTFRCVNCGRSEASARTCLESEAGEDQITGRIYRVTCKLRLEGRGLRHFGRSHFPRIRT